MAPNPPAGSSEGASWYERIPPPAWFFGCLGAGWGLDKAFPLSIPFPSLGWQLGPALLLFATATGLAVWAMRLFHLRRTTVLPFGVATALLTTGPYRLSRNPLYVATVATLVAFGLLLGTFWVFLSAAALVLALNRLVIPGEEAVLAGVFANDYANYARRVRRWLQPAGPVQGRGLLAHGDPLSEAEADAFPIVYPKPVKKQGLGQPDPVLKRLAPGHVTTAENVGRAMIRVAANGYAKRVLENPDINALSVTA